MTHANSSKTIGVGLIKSAVQSVWGILCEQPPVCHTFEDLFQSLRPDSCGENFQQISGSVKKEPSTEFIDLKFLFVDLKPRWVFQPEKDESK